MISYYILLILIGFMRVILYPITALSNVTLDPNITSAISTAGVNLQFVAIIAPLDTIFQILTIMLIIEGFIFGYKIIMWIIKKIPTIN